MYTPDLRLVRTIQYHGRHVTITGGKVRQEFDDQRLDAWGRTLVFLGLDKRRSIAEYRELAPGAWIPNDYGSAPSKKGPGVRHQIQFLAVNEDLDGQLAEAWGR